MFPTLFRIGGTPVTTWPILAFLGVWAAYFSMRREMRRLPLSGRDVLGLHLGGTIAAFAGAHGMFGLSVGARWDLPQALQILTGLSFYGGLVASTLYAAVHWRLEGWGRRARLGSVWDGMAAPAGWALFFGRLGCTLYGCCYGSPSGRWWGLPLNAGRWDFERRAFPEELRGVPLHPSPLYEAVGMLLILGMLARLGRAQRARPDLLPPGSLAAAFYVLYGILRFGLEAIRLDPRGEAWLGLYPSQWVALVTAPAAFAMLAWAAARGRKAPAGA